MGSRTVTAGGPASGPRVAVASPREAVSHLRLAVGSTDAAASAALVEALRAGDPEAAPMLFDRHGVHVRRVLIGVLGPDPEVADLVQDVFVTALESIARLNDGRKLRAWLTSIAVFKARELIRSRQRRKMLSLVCFWLAAEAPDLAPAIESSQGLRAVWRVLDRLPTDERLAFALRYVQGLELGEVASACRVSLATIKRRLRRAQSRFLVEAQQEPVLVEFLAGIAPWSRE